MRIKSRVCSLLLAGALLISLLPAAVPALAAALPVIESQPQNADISGGGNAVFSVEATGTGDLAYQWLILENDIAYSDPYNWTNNGSGKWSPVSDYAWASFELNIPEGGSFAFDYQLNIANYGGFYFEFYNGDGFGDSMSVYAHMDEPETVSWTGLAGGTYVLYVEFSCDALSEDNATYFFFPEYTALSGETGSTLTLSSGSPYYEAANAFVCAVTDEIGSVYSDRAYILKEHSVEFSGNGDGVSGLPASQQVMTFESAAEPTDAPLRTGYDFVGWASDAGGTNFFDFSTALTDDLTLYAVWNKVLTGSGDEETPYLIGSAEELASMRNRVNSGEGDYCYADYELTDNIDLSGVPEWIPIGAGNEFRGSFDGKGKTVSGLTVSSTEYAGLFGCVSNAVISNLTIGEGGSVSVGAYGYAGGIAGFAFSSIIENCVNYADVSASASDSSYAGGIVGYAEFNTISNCTNYGTVTALNCGAIAAYFYGSSVEGCENRGRVVPMLPAGYVTAEGSIMSYGENAGSSSVYDVIGLYNNRWIQTTYSSNGYIASFGAKDEYSYDYEGFTLAAWPQIVNGGRFVKLNYKITATEAVRAEDGKRLAVHADIQIGENDAAPISVIYDAQGAPIGLKMVNNESAHNSYGAQFNLYFRDTHGVTDADSFWFGFYGSREENSDADMEAYLQGLSWSETDAAGTWTATDNYGEYLWNEAEDVRYAGDSGMAVSWLLPDMSAGESRTFSVLIGVGRAAVPPTAHEMQYDEATGTVSFRVSDPEAVEDAEGTLTNPLAIYYGVDDQEEVRVSNPAVSKDGDAYLYSFRITENPGEGYHSLSVWGMNSDAGAMSSVMKTSFSNWTVPTFSVSGAVAMENQEAVPDQTTVVLKRGDELVGEAALGENGEFLFGKIPAGNYNLVATLPDGRVVTGRVDVVNQNVSGVSLVIPDGSKSSVVEVKEDTPKVVVGGLQDIFPGDASEYNDIFGAQEQDVLDAGGSVEIKLVAEKLDETGIVESRLGAIEAAVSADYKNGNALMYYIDLSLEKILRDQHGSVDQTKSGLIADAETPGLLEIVVPLPKELQGMENYAVYRYHNGAVQSITTQPDPVTGEYIKLNDSKTVLTIYAKFFSLYAIAYTTPPSYGMATSRPTISLPSNPEGGSVTLSDDRKTITVTPDDGYEIADVLIDGVSVGAVASYKFSDNKNHTVSVEFKRIHLCAAYGDIRSHWAYDYICIAVENGVMNGTGKAAFEPNLPMTRAMMATVLYRMDAEPSVSGLRHSFADAAVGSWYGDAVIWGADRGVVTGFSAEIFAPAERITREQMAAMLYRYAQHKGMDVGASEGLKGFADRDSVSEYALPAMSWAVEQGLIIGRTATELVPKGDASRAEVCTILSRFMQLAD